MADHLVLSVAALAATAGAAPTPPRAYHGPTALIWRTSGAGAACKLLSTAANVTSAGCLAACTASASRGCNALNYNTDSVHAKNCQLLQCSGSPVPKWPVPSWRGSSTFALPPGPPLPPPPSPMRLVLLDGTKRNARCLDGSRPGYYWKPGVGEDAQNFVLFLNGGDHERGAAAAAAAAAPSVAAATTVARADACRLGGWCWQLGPSKADPHSVPGGPDYNSWGKADTCWGRSHSALGSSNGSKPSMSDPLLNTPLANWSKAWMIYCDGASYAGDRNEPVLVSPAVTGVAGENRTLWFRGRANLDTVIDDLLAKGMARPGANATSLLGGCSAGGMGAIINCDKFASRLPPGSRARCIGDAGVFQDATSIHKQDSAFGKGLDVVRTQWANMVQVKMMLTLKLPLPACCAALCW